MPVLAIGATGQFAGLVVAALVSKGLGVRSLVHDPARADRVRELGADEAVAGDLRDRASIDAALTGVDAVFHVTPAFAPAPLRSILARAPRTLDSYLGELAA